MKNNLLIFFLSFLSISMAQENKTKSDLENPVSGVVFNASRKSNFSGFIGVNELTLFTVDYLLISRKKQELNLRRHHKTSLELVDTRQLFSVIDDEFFNEPNELYFQNNTLFLFSTLTGLKKKFNLIYLEIFNEFGERMSGRVIDTLGLDESYDLIESEEKQGFLIVKHDKFKNVFEQTLSLIAINAVGETEWATDIKSPSSLQNLEVKQLLYSIHSPVYILCDYGFNPNNGSIIDRSTDLINSKYAIWAYDPTSKFLKEFDIRIKKRWINGVEIALNSNKDLIVSGFINETRNQSINGVFSLHIDSSLNVISSNYYKFKRSFYAKFVEEKRLDKTKELENIELRNCIVLEDNSYFLIGEHFYQFTERNYDPRTNITTTTENYNYNSIVITYFSATGNHIWSDRIPKYQHSVNDFGYYSSFSVMQNKNDIYLFYNDIEKNNEIKPTDYFNYKSLSNNRRFQISYVQISEQGLKARGGLINAENNFVLRAKQSYQIDPSTFYLYAETGRTRRVFSVRPKK